MKVFELRKERAAHAQEARKLVELAITEKRDNTPEERQRIDACVASLGEYDRKIAVLERVESVEVDGQRSLDGRTPGAGPALDGKTPYSLLRAYRCMLGFERGGLEMEVSQEIATRSGKPAQGIYIPWTLANQRAVNTTTGAGSIANVLGTELIDLLRNKMVLQAMGARVMTDMTGGTFSLPKQTAASSAYWVAEGSSPTASNLTIGQVTWTPKTVGAFQDLTRKFILQTNQSAEALAREDLARVLAIELDRAGINGSGSGQQPLGILQDSNIPTVALGTNGGAPTWTNVLALESAVAVANAEFGKLGYLTSNKARAKMKATPKISGSQYSDFLWQNGQTGGIGEVNSYRAMATEQVPSNLSKGTSNGTLSALIYGNFDSVTYAFWSGLDLMVDPYTGSSSGTVRIVALQDADIQFRYELALAKTVDVDPS